MATFPPLCSRCPLWLKFFRRAADALHVALATANRCRLIVSWNFKHIVHFDKIPLYNGVNLINGYDTLSINTPSEVIAYED